MTAARNRWLFLLSYDEESNQAADKQNAEECRRRKGNGIGGFDDNLSFYRSR